MKISITELANITGMDRRRIRAALSNLKHEKGVKGALLFESRDALPLLYTGEEYDSEKERARLTKHQADKTEIEVESMRGRLLPEEEVVENGQMMVGAFRSRILSIPVKLAPELAIISDVQVIKSMLQKVHYEALNELSGFGQPTQ